MKQKALGIIIWGVGKRCNEILSQYERYRDVWKNGEVVGLVDNDSDKWGKKVHDIKIYSPLELDNINFNKIIISVTGTFRREIETQILRDIESGYDLYDAHMSEKLNFYYIKNKIYETDVLKYKKAYIDVGDFTYGVPEVTHFQNEGARLIIGKFCSMAAGIKFLLGGEHCKIILQPILFL